ncbi:MAG TPA: ABC transporter transmembrane domain-containing protein, partial [Chthoniobacterales bacterium]
MSDKKKLPFWQLLKAWAQPYRMLAGFMYPYRGRFFIGVAFGAGFALLTASLAPTLYLVARQIFSAAGGAPKLPGFLANLELPEWMSLHPDLAGVVVACILIPSVMLVRSLFSYGNSYFMAWVALRMLSDLRTAVFAHVASQSMDFFNQARSGKLMSRITNDTRVAQNAFTSVAGDLFRDPIAVLGGVVVLFVLDWKFCLAMLVLFPVCLVPIAIFGRKVR